MPISPRLVVEVFEHQYYRGRKLTIVGPVDDTNEIGASETISSIKIYKGPGFRASPNYKAIFYEHSNYQGRRLVLAPGFYPNIHEIPYNFGDIISSVNYSPAANPTPPEYGAIPVIVEVFRDPQYLGNHSLVLRDISDLRDVGMNNAISSIRLRRGPNFPFSGCQVNFYEGINFEGQRFTINLGSREFQKEIGNLHDRFRFGDTISSIKIIPMGTFNVLIVVGDSRSLESPILESLPEVGGFRFNYELVKVNPNPDNFGDSNYAQRLSSVDLSNFDIIWFTWNAPGHDQQYFIEDSEERIRDFVRKGGILWCSGVDNNIIPPDGERIKEPMWRGDWLPVKQHPIRVVNSEDVNIEITPEGHKTGLFTWPHTIDVNAITTDDHWLTEDPDYVPLARRQDERKDPVSFVMHWGDGYYVAFALDTRDAVRSALAKTLIENALCYLASLAWQSSPRQPLRARHRVATSRI